MSALEKRYARALFLALEPRERLGAETALQSGTELLTGNGELWRALTSPCVRPKEKDALLLRVLPQETPSILRSAYRLLCEKGRMVLLPGIAEEYHALCLEEENAGEGVVRSARPLGQGEVEKLSQALCQRHGKSRVALRCETDPSLLGGFVLQLGDTVYDQSVRGMLNGLRRSLKER